MVKRGHEHFGQLAGAKELGETLGVAAVGLDLIPGALGNERGSDDVAGEVHGGDPAVQVIACGARLVAKDDFRAGSGQFADEPQDGIGMVVDGAIETSGIAAFMGDGDGDFFLGDIETDVLCGTIHGKQLLFPVSSEMGFTDSILTYGCGKSELPFVHHN